MKQCISHTFYKLILTFLNTYWAKANVNNNKIFFKNTFFYIQVTLKYNTFFNLINQCIPSFFRWGRNDLTFHLLTYTFPCYLPIDFFPVQWLIGETEEQTNQGNQNT